MKILAFICAFGIAYGANMEDIDNDIKALNSDVAISPIIDSLKSFSKDKSLELLDSLTSPFSDDDIAQNLALSAIFNQKALINGEWHAIGSTINGYKITSIHTKHIILQKAKTSYILRVDGELEEREHK